MMTNRAASARLRVRRLVMASGALALVAATSAATETSRGVIVLWSANDQWVKIEPQDDPDTSEETLRPVFAREELRDLAPRLAAGLAKAGPQQDVTFSTIASHSLISGGVIKDPGVNAGRVFVDNARLNVIFGELQSGYRKRNVYGQRTEDFTPRQKGSRQKAEEHKWPLAARAGVEFHSGGDGVRNDWVTIDSAVVSSQAAAASDAAESPAAAAPAAAGSARGPEAKTSSADLEQRLQKLKELRDKNLISEEAYRAKVEELLSEL